MKKTTALVSILSLSTVFALTTLNVFAESNDNEPNKGNHTQTLGTTSLRSEHGDRQGGEDQNNQMRSERDNQDSEGDTQDENDATEMSLHDHMSQVSNINVAVNLPIVSSATISTYADIVSILTQYQSVINTITASGTLRNSSSTLSVQEQAVLGKLMHKHNGVFNRLSARASDLSSQIKDLVNVLTPLGSTTITSSFNLKDLIISQLKDFAGAINDLSTLGNTSVDIIDQETN